MEGIRWRRPCALKHGCFLHVSVGSSLGIWSDLMKELAMSSVLIEAQMLMGVAVMYLLDALQLRL
jgi:hypothetical protein